MEFSNQNTFDEGRIFNGTPVSPTSVVHQYHVTLLYVVTSQIVPHHPSNMCGSTLITLRYSLVQKYMFAIQYKLMKTYTLNRFALTAGHCAFTIATNNYNTRVLHIDGFRGLVNRCKYNRNLTAGEDYIEKRGIDSAYVGPDYDNTRPYDPGNSEL